MATAESEDTSQQTEVYIHTVTEADIRKAVVGLDPDGLDHLFANLGIPQYLISHAKKSANTDDTILQARAVLYMWRKKEGNSFTKEILFNEKDKILQERTGKSVRDTEEEEFLKECQDQLRQKYLSEMKVQLAPWAPNHLREMDAIFVDLELEKEEVSQSTGKEKRLENNEDLVTIKINAGLRANRILIQGIAGSGKSTLLDNIAYKWASQLDAAQSTNPALSQFDLIFAIRIHEISDKNESIEEIVFDQILEDGPHVSHASLKSYLQSNAKRCLFLIDGIDDDSSIGILDHSTTVEMSRLLYNRLYKQSCVIASTRPDILENTGCNLKSFTKVKLIGFSDTNIQEYIRKYFAVDDANNSQLLRRLREEPHVWNLAQTPLLLLFFCLLWEDPDQAERSLPNTRTKLYQETIHSLWVRLHCNLSEKDGVGKRESPLTMAKCLDNLGKVTLKGLLDQSKEKVLFSNSDFDEATLSLALRVGILSRRKTRSKTYLKTVNFLHTSIQDFCSANCLASLYLTNIEKCKEYVAKLMDSTWILRIWRGRRDDVYTFCAGCRPETTTLVTRQLLANADIFHQASNEGRLYRVHDTSIKSILFEGIVLPECNSSNRIITTNERVEGKFEQARDVFMPCITILFVLAFEAQLTFEECDKLVSILSTTNLTLSFVWVLHMNHEKCIHYHLNLLETVTDTNIGLLFSTLSHLSVYFPRNEFPRCYHLLLSMLNYTKQLRCFDFKFRCTSNQVFNFSDMFDTLANLENLQELHLERDVSDSNTHYDVAITHSLRKLCHLKLQGLHLIHLTVTSTSMAQFLRSSKSLKELIIVTTPGSIMNDTFSMMKAISNIRSLSDLGLGGVAIGRGVKCLKCIVPQLSELLLLQPSFGAWDVHELVSYLRKAEKLTELGLNGILLDTSMSHLADQLKHMVNLKKLNLENTDLGNRECHILADGIKTMSSLFSLNLTKNPDIGLEGRQALESMRTLPQFQHFEIGFDPIPPEAHLVQVNANRESAAAFYLLPALPDCCSCMSQIYDVIRCKRRLQHHHQSDILNT